MLHLVGVAGWVMGERYQIHDGDEIVIGRSRSCDISLRRIRTYLSMDKEKRDLDHDFNTVSRQHIRLKYSGGDLRVEDLSSNGTFVDEEELSEATTVNVGVQPIYIRLGTRECFQVKLDRQQHHESSVISVGDESSVIAS